MRCIVLPMFLCSHMQIDGLMWIANCVFQGAGLNGRAIDTNTGLGLIAGRQRAPALFIQGESTSCRITGALLS